MIPFCALALGLASIVPAHAERGSNSSRTWTISRPGTYTLSRDITVSEGDAIVITASGVTLDLNGRTVSTRNAGTGRGITIDDADHVTIKNGSVTGFNTNVSVSSSEGSCVEELKVIGKGLAPNNGPSEIGILVLNSRSSVIRENIVSSVNLGSSCVARKAPETASSRTSSSVAPPTAATFGICYNPAPGAGNVGPSGDSIYNNHIARFNFAVSVSAGSSSNLFIDNTLSSFSGAFRDPSSFEAQGGTNAEFDNASTIISQPAP